MHVQIGDGVANGVERAVVVAIDEEPRVVDGGTGRRVRSSSLDERRRVAVDLDCHTVPDAAELVDRPVGGDHAVAEDHDRVADPFDLLEQVRRQQHVDAELGAAAPDQLEHLVALHGIETVGRLVEQDQVAGHGRSPGRA